MTSILAQSRPQKARKTWRNSKIRYWCRKVVPATRRVAYTIRRWRSAILVTSAFGMLDLAAYGFSTIAGHAAVGLSLLILNSIAGEGGR